MSTANKKSYAAAVSEIVPQNNIASTTDHNSLGAKQVEINRLRNELDDAAIFKQSNDFHIRRSKNVYLRCLLEKYRFKMFEKHLHKPQPSGNYPKIKQIKLITLKERGYQPDEPYHEHHETTNFMEELLDILVTHQIAENPREWELIDFSRGWSITRNQLKSYKRLSKEIHSAGELDIKKVLDDREFMKELLINDQSAYKDIFHQVFTSQL